MALFDGQDPGLALDLGSMLAKVTEETIATRAATAFPPADALIVIAISPDATALPDACVITTPAEAAACP
jgi:hypothetical protein